MQGTFSGATLCQLEPARDRTDRHVHQLRQRCSALQPLLRLQPVDIEGIYLVLTVFGPLTFELTWVTELSFSLPLLKLAFVVGPAPMKLPPASMPAANPTLALPDLLLFLLALVA